MKSFFKILVAIAASIPVTAQATPNNTPSGYITMMYGGLTTAFMRIQTDFTFANPESCAVPDGYIVDPADPGNVLFSSMLLNAYMSHRKVSLVIDGCTQSRPRIISVALWPN